MPSARDSNEAPTAPEHRRPPTLLRVLLVVVVLEAVALVVLAGQGVVAVVRGDSSAVGVTLFLVAFFLAMAAVLLLCVRALLAGRRGARAPVVTWQLLQAATAVTLIPSGSPTAWAALGASLVVVVLMMTRPVVEHTVPAARRGPADPTA